MPPLNDTEAFPYCNLDQFLVCERGAEGKFDNNNNNNNDNNDDDDDDDDATKTKEQN